MRKTAPFLKGRTILQTFREWDVDGKGWIDRSELMKILMEIGCSRRDSEAATTKADTNCDGKIDYGLFCTWLCNEEEVRCSNGCERLLWDRRYQTCCRSCKCSAGKRHGSLCDGHHESMSAGAIPTEWRAITGEQLQHVAVEIKDKCLREGWKNREGKSLNPEEVTLYDLNKYLILPLTIPSGIRISGLKCGHACVGSPVTEISTDAHGKVLSLDTVRDVMHVSVSVGRFEKPTGSLDFLVDGKPGASWGDFDIQPVEHCSYVGLLTTSPQKPIWFVSHWWGEPVFAFVSIIRTHAKIRGLDAKAPYWVCAYANDQHDLRNDVTADPRESSFFRALMGKQCQGVLLALNEDMVNHAAAVAFTRIWCVFEIHTSLTGHECRSSLLLDIGATHKRKTCVVTDGLTEEETMLESVIQGMGRKKKVERERSFPVAVLQEGLSVELEKALSSDESDRRHILNVIAGVSDLDVAPPSSHERFDAVNTSLRGIFACSALPLAAASGLIEKMRLAEVLALDVARKTLNLSLADLALKDSDATLVLQGMPPNLETLELDLKRNDIGDDGIENLARCIAGLPGLVSVDLSLACTKISDRGLKAFAAYLSNMSKLKKLRLHMRACGIGTSGLIALGEAFQGLTAMADLQLNVSKCDAIGDEALAGIGKAVAILHELCQFYFNSSGNPDVSDVGIKALCIGLGQAPKINKVRVTATQTKATSAYWKVWSLQHIKRLAA